MNKHHLRTIAKLGVPLVVGSVLQILMNTMDMMFISRLGTAFAAASAMGTSIAGVIFVFSMLVSAGAVALVARKQGEQDLDGIRRYSGASVGLAGLIGLLASLVSLIFSREIIMIYDPKPELLSIIHDYVSILFMFIFVVFLNSTLRSIIQATGDTKNPLYIFGGANILNILLDYIFIEVMSFGIKGAAAATVISQSVACLLMGILLINHIYDSRVKLFIKNIFFKLQDAINVLRIGVWACIQSVARPITGLIMMRIIYSAGGDQGSAAFGIGLTIVNYFFIVLTGLAGAITILVGQKIGERQVEEAKAYVKEGIRLGHLNFAIFFIPFFLVPHFLFIPFKATPEVVDIGVSYLRIVYASFFVVGITFMYRGAFSGTGHTYQPMLAALTANVLCKVSMAYAAVHWLDWGLNGVWIAISASVWIEFFMIRYFYKKDRLYIV